MNPSDVAEGQAEACSCGSISFSFTINKRFWQIACDDCGKTGVWMPSKAAAIEQWNRTARGLDPLPEQPKGGEPCANSSVCATTATLGTVHSTHQTASNAAPQSSDPAGEAAELVSLIQAGTDYWIQFSAPGIGKRAFHLDRGPEPQWLRESWEGFCNQLAQLTAQRDALQSDLDSTRRSRDSWQQLVGDALERYDKAVEERDEARRERDAKADLATGLARELDKIGFYFAGEPKHDHVSKRVLDTLTGLPEPTREINRWRQAARDAEADRDRLAKELEEAKRWGVAEARALADLGVKWGEERDALKQQLAEAEGKEAHRWYDALNGVLHKQSPDAHLDGSGADSGDLLDAALVEVNQAFDYWEDRAYDALVEMGLSDTLDEYPKALDALIDIFPNDNVEEGDPTRDQLKLRVASLLQELETVKKDLVDTIAASLPAIDARTEHTARLAAEAAMRQMRVKGIALCDAIHALHGHLFEQCLSNSVYNAWGQEVNCTLINNAQELALTTRRELEGGK